MINGTDKLKFASQKVVKHVFVIMPFVGANTRDEEALNSFFSGEIKSTIEECNSFRYQYRVTRSDDTLNITKKIVSDLYTSDIVICDLSGPMANPNVMYELGVRMAVSRNAVILIREDNDNNKNIFDIQGLFAEKYTTEHYHKLRKFLIGKLEEFENGEATYLSPVLDIIEQDMFLLERLSTERAARLLSSFYRGLLQINVNTVLMLQEQTGMVFNVEEFDTSLKKLRHECLSHMDTINLQMSFAPDPAIDYYISHRYLDTVVPEVVENEFARRLIDYRCLYYSTIQRQEHLQQVIMFDFINDTYYFTIIAQYLISYLQETDENKKKVALEAVEKMFKKLKSSQYE